MVLVAGALWGTIGIFVNTLESLGVGTMSTAAFRLLAGAAWMLPILLVMGASGYTGVRDPFALVRVSPRSLLWCVLVGVFGLALANWAYYESMGAVGMSTASVLLYTSPVFGCVLGRVLFHERVTRSKLLAVACNVVGCVSVATGGDLTGVTVDGYGIAMGLIAGLLGALLPIFSGKASSGANPLAATFYGFVAGGVVAGAASYPWADVVRVGSPAVLVFAGFGLIPTALAYFFYMTGLSRGLEASKVPVVASVETVATVCVGTIVYAEPAGPVKVLGIALVLASIVVMNADLGRLLESPVVAWLRANPIAGRVVESASFNPGAWNHEKVREWNELLESSDWQAWIATR